MLCYISCSGTFLNYCCQATQEPFHVIIYLKHVKQLGSLENHPTTSQPIYPSPNSKVAET